MLNSYY